MPPATAPVFPQPIDDVCGPACLKTALAILGKRISFSRLNDLCKNNKNGTSVKNLIRAANKLGVSVMYVEYANRRHIRSVARYDPQKPCVAIVDYLAKDQPPYEETGHYSTLASFSDKRSKIYLLDSSQGCKVSYNWSKFKSQWYDYDYRRIKLKKHKSRTYKLTKKWHHRLLLVLARDPDFLPRFRHSTTRLYSVSPSV